MSVGAQSSSQKRGCLQWRVVALGAVGLVVGNWLRLKVRFFHGLEILADSLVYPWVLVLLPVKTEES